MNITKQTIAAIHRAYQAEALKHFGAFNGPGRRLMEREAAVFQAVVDGAASAAEAREFTDTLRAMQLLRGVVNETAAEVTAGPFKVRPEQYTAACNRYADANGMGHWRFYGEPGDGCDEWVRVDGLTAYVSFRTASQNRMEYLRDIDTRYPLGRERPEIELPPGAKRPQHGLWQCEAGHLTTIAVETITHPEACPVCLSPVQPLPKKQPAAEFRRCPCGHINGDGFRACPVCLENTEAMPPEMLRPKAEPVKESLPTPPKSAFDPAKAVVIPAGVPHTPRHFAKPFTPVVVAVHIVDGFFEVPGERGGSLHYRLEQRRQLPRKMNGIARFLMEDMTVCEVHSYGQGRQLIHRGNAVRTGNPRPHATPDTP